MGKIYYILSKPGRLFLLEFTLGGWAKYIIYFQTQGGSSNGSLPLADGHASNADADADVDAHRYIGDKTQGRSSNGSLPMADGHIILYIIWV